MRSRKAQFLSLVAALIVGLGAGVLVRPALGAAGPPRRFHTTADSVTWITTMRYPDWFRKKYRYKELIGWISNWQSGNAAKWKGVPNQDLRFGVMEIDPGTTYPFHSHPAPEVYYVVNGRAQWTLGNDTFEAPAGTTIYTTPNTRHQIKNVGGDTLHLVYVWYAPGGNRSVLDSASKMLEGWDRPR
ncbi:MAG: cupin domain-containing protein [Gemmatimonadales bacterium]